MKLNLLALVLVVVVSCLFDFLDAQERIVGGEVSSITSSPYMIALHQYSEYYCGGALVTLQHVVTAAHCVEGFDPAIITAVAGINTLMEMGQRRDVSKIWYPREFTRKTMNMDIAVIKVRSPFYPGPKVATIPLCTTALTLNTMLRLSGWGKTGEKEPYASVRLRTVTVPMIQRQLCASYYSHTNVALTPTMVCAGAGHKDACNGDSGGPGVVNNELCTVVSFGVGCARHNFPGVYTDVNNPYIRSFLNECLRR